MIATGHRATYTRTQGVRHLFAAMNLGKNKMYGHIKKRKRRGEFLELCRYLRSFTALREFALNDTGRADQGGSTDSRARRPVTASARTDEQSGEA
ncbi:hypothetical protein [Microtetraspora sp. NBRC 16547]|uniref:hypothetical protein n=1 Tax=Microtetraspora sp. NBRC 16547 TaxID=3030993 RepID=UPI0024A6098C|nr:hypothetical protein [Microtetraspora sp. NBRC 16547]GLW96600.1 hypothetical protein Misp02_06870 [Microtetraspora sp. NBRC 16547]